MPATMEHGGELPLQSSSHRAAPSSLCVQGYAYIWWSASAGPVGGCTLQECRRRLFEVIHGNATSKRRRDSSWFFKMSEPSEMFLHETRIYHYSLWFPYSCENMCASVRLHSYRLQHLAASLVTRPGIVWTPKWSASGLPDSCRISCTKRLVRQAESRPFRGIWWAEPPQQT